MDDIEPFKSFANKKISANTIFKEILAGQITMNNVTQSTYYNYPPTNISKGEETKYIKERLDSFSIKKMNDIFSNKIIINFNPKTVYTTMGNVEIILYNNTSKRYYHLMLGRNVAGYYFPSSFIVEPSDKYVKNQITTNAKKLEIMDYKTRKIILEYTYNIPLKGKEIH